MSRTARSALAANPIYATLHESSYADGVPTRWSGHRLLPDELVEQGFFTAEHVFPWMFDDYGALEPHKDAAEILAQHEWPKLYNPDVLRHNEVPVAATIYVNDLYVEREYAEETAAQISWPASVDHQRVRTQRTARRRRARTRPADRHGQGPRLTALRRKSASLVVTRERKEGAN
jgi:hypothetical protein